MKEELVSRWASLALHDLDQADKVESNSWAVFGYQQAAEKILKAYLVRHDVAFGKTHDISELLLKCAGIDSAFASFADGAAELSKHATFFRYPNEEGIDAATGEYRAEAGRYAHKVVRFTTAKLGRLKKTATGRVDLDTPLGTPRSSGRRRR